MLGKTSGNSAQNCYGAGTNAILLFISSGKVRSSIRIEQQCCGFSATALLYDLDGCFVWTLLTAPSAPAHEFSYLVQCGVYFELDPHDSALDRCSCRVSRNTAVGESATRRELVGPDVSWVHRKEL